jgi:hypothetical protein
MQSICHYIETLSVWKQIAIAAAFFTSFGLTLDLLSFALTKIHMWRELRIDNQIVAYLVRELELYPSIEDALGQLSTFYYRSSLEIAGELNRSAVDIRQRLERLEIAKRVERPGRLSDVWTASEHERHDRSQ